jgi:hypothetical protein
MAFRLPRAKPKVAAMEDIMALLLNVLVFLVQISLVAFVARGGWLLLREGLAAMKTAAEDGFERVASLVLLALLCTTIAAI